MRWSSEAESQAAQIITTPTRATFFEPSVKSCPRPSTPTEKGTDLPLGPIKTAKATDDQPIEELARFDRRAAELKLQILS